MAFHALRQEKESNKALLLQDELVNSMNPAIESVHADIMQKGAKMTTKARTDTLKIAQVMMGRRLYSYFEHWKKFAEYKRTKVIETMKTRLIGVNRDNLRLAFDRFKYKDARRHKVKRAVMVLEAESTCDSFRSEVVEGEKQIKK